MRIDVEIWEEGVGTFSLGIDDSDIGGIAVGQKLLVDAGAADDVNFRGWIIMHETAQLIEIVRNHGISLEIWVASQDDVVTIWQWFAARESLESFAAVNNAVASGQFTKVFEIFRNVKDKLTIFADGPVLVNCDD